MITVADLSPDEVSALAFLVEQHRARAGHESWDRPGIVAHLTKMDADAPTAFAAALAAAEDPGARTAAALVFGKYLAAVSVGQVPAGPVCEICGRSMPTHDRMAQLTGDQHPFTIEAPPRRSRPVPPKLREAS